MLRSLGHSVRQILTTVFLFTPFIISAAVPVGPSAPKEATKAPSAITNKQIGNLPGLDIPELDLAIVVLNPKIDEEEENLRHQGIWPEVRKTESIRSAYKIKEAIEKLAQFSHVYVVPSVDVSADLYIQGKIERSTTEILHLRWRLTDARGANWLNWETKKHRVELGWHQRFYEAGKDPFQPLYNAIARDVYNKLALVARDDAKIERRNTTLIKRGKTPRLTQLEAVTYTRDLVLARYFSPDLYSDALKVERNQWRIRYIPDMQNDDWSRIEAFAQRDQNILDVYDKAYAQFTSTVSPQYELWLNEVFPYARKARLDRRSAQTKKIIGSTILLATAGAALDSPAGGARDTIATVGGVVGGGLIYAGIQDSEDFKQNLALFDEMTSNYHDTFKPINIEISGKTEELRGTAAEQFSRWRQVLKETYDRAEVDSHDILIVEAPSQPIATNSVAEGDKQDQ